jgi:hypothetical protein
MLRSWRPSNSQVRKFRCSEDRIGDMHKGPGREYPDIERELDANFHDLRCGEATTQGPLDHATPREVVLPLDHPGRQGADDPAFHVGAPGVFGGKFTVNPSALDFPDVVLSGDQKGWRKSAPFRSVK